MGDITRDLRGEIDGIGINPRPTDTTAYVTCPVCHKSRGVTVPLGRGRYEYLEWARYLANFKQLVKCACGVEYTVRQSINLYTEVEDTNEKIGSERAVRRIPEIV